MPLWLCHLHPGGCRLLYRYEDAVMLAAVVLSAVTVPIVPWSTSLTMLIAVYCIIGLAEGMENAGTFFLCPHLLYCCTAQNIILSYTSKLIDFVYFWIIML